MTVGAAIGVELLELGEATAVELALEAVEEADDVVALVECLLELEDLPLVVEELSVLLDEEEDAHGICAEASIEPFES